MQRCCDAVLDEYHLNSFWTIWIPKGHYDPRPIRLVMRKGAMRHWGLDQLADLLKPAPDSPLRWAKDPAARGRSLTKNRLHIAYDRGPEFRHPGMSCFTLGKGSTEATLDLIAHFLDTQPHPWLYIGTPTRKKLRVPALSLKTHSPAA